MGDITSLPSSKKIKWVSLASNEPNLINVFHMLKPKKSRYIKVLLEDTLYEGVF